MDSKGTVNRSSLIQSYHTQISVKNQFSIKRNSPKTRQLSAPSVFRKNNSRLASPFDIMGTRRSSRPLVSSKQKGSRHANSRPPSRLSCVMRSPDAPRRAATFRRRTPAVRLFSMARRRLSFPAESRRLRAPRPLERARSRPGRYSFRSRRDDPASRPRPPISRQTPLLPRTTPARRPRPDSRRRDLLRSLDPAARLEARSDPRPLKDAPRRARRRFRALAAPRGGSERKISARNSRGKGGLLSRDELRRGGRSPHDADACVR